MMPAFPSPRSVLSASVFALVLLACCGSQAHAQDALPPDVQFDVLRLEIVEAAKRERHREVLVIAERMRKTGQPLPPELPFLEAKAFYGVGALAMSRRALATYLKEVGRAGKDYDEAVRLFVRVKSELEDNARATREAASLRADFEVVRAAWHAQTARVAEWKKRAVVFGGPDDDSAAALARTVEGGIVLAGALHVRKTQDDKPVDVTLPWITAFNADGKRIWHRPLGSASDPGSLRSVTPVPGKGFLFGGVQKGFQIAAMTDRLGNILANGEGDPWIIAFAPSAGEGGIARLLENGDIIAIGAEEIGKDETTGKANARLPVAVRLSPKGKPLGKHILGRGGTARWYDVKDAMVLAGGDVIVAGETRVTDGDAASAEGYLIRFKPTGEEVWTRRIAATRAGGAALTGLAADADGIYAVGRDGAEMAYMKFAPDGRPLWRHTRGVTATPAAFARFCAVPEPAEKLAAAYRAGAKRDKTAKTAGAEGDPLADLRQVRAFACRSDKGFAAATAIAPGGKGFLILGVAGHEGDPATRISATMIDAAGGVAWESIHGDGPINVATGALATGDDGFVAAGITNNWGRDMLVFKLGPQGSLRPFASLAPKAPKQPGPASGTKQVRPNGAEKTAKPEAAVEKVPASDNSPGAEAAAPVAPDSDRRDRDRTKPESSPASGEASYDLIDLLDGLFGGSSAPAEKRPEKQSE